MSNPSAGAVARSDDPVSNVLKWVLLVVAVACFAMLAWTTKLTYEAAPPLPAQIVGPGGAALMTQADIVAGKAFYDKTVIWQWLRLPGDVVFAAGALAMAWDFFVKLRPIMPKLVGGRAGAGSPSPAPAE